jgi:hypothetical protein
MTTDLRASFKQALNLSDAKRAELETELLETFDSPKAVRAAWTKELRKRLADIKACRGVTLGAEDELVELRSSRAQGTQRRQPAGES